MNRSEMLASIIKAQMKPAEFFPLFTPGDTIDIHYKIIEGEKERIQIFQGVLISDRGAGIHRMLRVRRIIASEGVERTFPAHNPRLVKIEVVRRGDSRRAKLYYLRERFGKSRRLRDQRRGLKHVVGHAATGRESGG
ncbi:MAG: 50S ribosomal protein L19 [Phycisphaerales bacterium]|nr:50S ribosomal protein L19 [Phycisphaerales bacterium]